MLSFDFEEPTFHTCECCGGRTTHLTRFVYQDGDAYAVYYARFSDHPGERYVQAVVSIGDWSEDSGPWDRVAFALNIWVANDRFQSESALPARAPGRGSRSSAGCSTATRRSGMSWSGKSFTSAITWSRRTGRCASISRARSDE